MVMKAFFKSSLTSWVMLWWFSETSNVKVWYVVFGHRSLTSTFTSHFLDYWKFAWIIPLIEILSAKLSQVLKNEGPIGQ